MAEITLTPPAAVPVVEKEKAAGMVPLTDDQKENLLVKASLVTKTIVEKSIMDQDFKSQVDAVHAMGNQEIRQAAGMSNRFLARPAAATSNLGDTSPVGLKLIDLRDTIEDLDPSKQGASLLSPRKLLGLIPYGNHLKAYFRKYQSSQAHINAIIEGLLNGQDELRKDNSAIEIEKAELWALMGKIEGYIYMGKELDKQLESQVAALESQDPEKARVVRDEVLFYVRQKVQDLLTQMATTVQGYLALDLVRKNNLELIKGVDRATSTTVSALRTAVIVAQALSNQKLVLDQINALNKTTGDLVAGTASMLRQQASEIHQQASSTTIDLDKLQSAFSDIYATFEDISTYKAEALNNMKESVNVLTEGLEKSKPFLAQVASESSNPNSVAPALNI
ncbi:toxic anion resistance protein [Vibrio sp. WXL210]|uniref:toxic anion resistance protein n=1 Tax=Vibrio sp. WXL210 TaxID=3450709 RepID=UPI003EC7070B